MPAGWVVYPAREPNSEAMQCANYSRLEWRVAPSETRAPQITLRPQPYGSKSSKLELPYGVKAQRGMLGVESSLKIQNGSLLGFDGGEFGGGLWFAGLNGETQQLSAENVHGFMETPQGVLVFVGLAHLGLDSGRVLIVPYAVKSPTDLRTFAELDGSPEAFTKLASDSALVVTNRGISRISPTGLPEPLITTRFGGLYPNSVASTANGDIYVGMRLFVVRVVNESGKYNQEWLVPESCKHFKVRGLDCICGK
jgi:hypothetical protein